MIKNFEYVFMITFILSLLANGMGYEPRTLFFLTGSFSFLLSFVCYLDNEDKEEKEVKKK